MHACSIRAHCQGGKQAAENPIVRPLVVHSALKRALTDTGALPRRQVSEAQIRRPLVVHSAPKRALTNTGALPRRQVSETPIRRPLVVRSVLQRAPNLRRSASTADRRAAHGGRLTAASALCQKILKALAGHPHRSASASWWNDDMLTRIWRTQAASLLALGRVQASRPGSVACSFTVIPGDSWRL